MFSSPTDHNISLCGSQQSINITGCRFSIYPMSDNYVDIILGAVKQIDTSKVWSNTDHLSTLYRGRQSHVIDCVRAAFIYAGQTNNHLSSELIFSHGCPGDIEADSFLCVDDTIQNLSATELGQFKVYAKISFYTFGIANYMEHIMHVIALANQHQLNPQKSHYVTLIEGTATDLFSYFDAVLHYAHQHLSHYVLATTLSINSPSIQSCNGANDE